VDARTLVERVVERAGLMVRVAEIDRQLAVVSPLQVHSGATGKANLPNLLARLAAEQREPLRIADFVALARQSGYRSDAEDFPNLVYHALLKLVKAGVLMKDREARSYILTVPVSDV
jgi:hypothetical protein